MIRTKGVGRGYRAISDTVTRLRRPTIGVDVQLGNKLGSDKSVS